MRIEIKKAQGNVYAYKKVLLQLLDTYRRKNHDYGNSFSILFEKIGMPYAYGHMAEKLERIYSLMQKDAKVDESMDDSLLDLASYAILTYIERMNRKNRLQ